MEGSNVWRNEGPRKEWDMGAVRRPYEKTPISCKWVFTQIQL